MQHDIIATTTDSVIMSSRLQWNVIVSSCLQIKAIVLLLLLARLINRQVEMFRVFGRRRPLQFCCQCGRLRRAVEKVVGVMRRNTTVEAMVARSQVDSLHVLTMDSVVTGAQLYQYCSCLPWQCLFGSSNRLRSPLSSFDELLSIAVLTASW